MLDQATKLLTRNSADVGAKAAKAEQDIAVLQGRIEELTHTMEQQGRQSADERNRLETRLAALEQTQNKIVDKVAPTMPDDKEQLWQQAAQRLASGQRDDGRRFYRVFIQRFPADPRAAQAYLAIGMSFVQESKYPNAAAEFQKVLDRLPVGARGARGDVAAVAGVRAAALLHRRALAARRSREALPEVAARQRRQDRAQDHRQAAQVQLHQLDARSRRWRAFGWGSAQIWSRGPRAGGTFPCSNTFQRRQADLLDGTPVAAERTARGKVPPAHVPSQPDASLHLGHSPQVALAYTLDTSPG